MPRTAAPALVLCALLVASPALALNPRSFVASYGNDSNNCQRATPCRAFAIAIAATSTGGEVVVLDSAGYGGATITTPITLTSPAGVLAAVNSTMTINLAGQNDVVRLDGLSFMGSGIDVIGIGRVMLRNLRIAGAGTGIHVNSPGGAIVRGSDIDIYGPGSYGVNLTASSGMNVVTFDRLRVEGTYFGVWVADHTTLTVRDCTLTGRSEDSNQNYGALLNQPTLLASDTTVSVENCLVSNWYTAFGSPLNSGGNGSKLFLQNNTVRTCSNGAWGHPTYLTVTSFGDNRFIEVNSATSGFATQGTN